MKIRNGWVGNSSSSSFILVGYHVKNDIFENDIDELTEKFINEKCDGDETLYDVYNFYDWLNKLISYKDDIQIQYGLDDYGAESIFIGVNPNSMKDNETLIHFRTRIANLINDKLDVNINPNDIQLYYDYGVD